MHSTMTDNQSFVSANTPLGDKIYRYFFISALVTIFTLGCMWGAVNLLLMGSRIGK